MPLTIISADRGKGKTSFLLACAAQQGRSVGGIAAPAVFEDGRRVGYDLIDLYSGARRPLARRVHLEETVPTVGVYHFEDAALAEGNAAVIAAVRAGLDIVAIDEVGPLEFRGGGWAPALEFALSDGGWNQELIVVVRPSLVDGLAVRFPSPRWATAVKCRCTMGSF